MYAHLKPSVRGIDSYPFFDVYNKPKSSVFSDARMYTFPFMWDAKHSTDAPREYVEQALSTRHSYTEGRFLRYRKKWPWNGIRPISFTTQFNRNVKKDIPYFQRRFR